MMMNGGENFIFRDARNETVKPAFNVDVTVTNIRLSTSRRGFRILRNQESDRRQIMAYSRHAIEFQSID